MDQPVSSTKKQKTNHDLMKLIIVIAIIGLVGIGLGYYYSQLPENNPQKNQSNCEQAGGEWVEDQCLLSNRLAGEDCTDGGQCQSGVCFPPELTAAQMAALENGPLEGITGTCYPEELIIDCIKQVNHGVVSKESLCY